MGTRARLWAGKAGSARAPRKEGWAQAERAEVRTGRAGLTQLRGGRSVIESYRPVMATPPDFVSQNLKPYKVNNRALEDGSASKVACCQAW